MTNPTEEESFYEQLQKELREDPLFRLATLGTEAEAFLQGPLGKHLIEKAERQIEAGYQALAAADPFDTARIVAIQSQIRVAQAVPQWMVEAINEGQNALAQIHERESFE